MRRALALVLAVLLVPVPAPSQASAPPVPPVEEAYRLALDRVAFHVESAAQTVGENTSTIRDARAKLDRAQTAVDERRWSHARDSAARALALATFAEAREAAEQSEDTERALRSSAGTERRSTRSLVSDLGRGLDQAVRTGVDLRQADTVLLASELVALAGDRLDGWSVQLRGWPADPPRRPGPFQAAVGARVPTWIALELSRGLADLGEQPIGPVVGERVVGQVARALIPLVANVSQGRTADAADRIEALERAGSPVRAIGEALAWAREVPRARASVSNVTRADADAIVDRLGGVLDEPDALGVLDETELQAVQVGHALGDANASLASAEDDLAANRSRLAVGHALAGLGAVSSARLGGAVLRGLAGLGGTTDVIVLADGTAGDLVVAKRDTGFAPGADGSRFLLQAGILAGAATALVAAAGLVRRTKR